jgi:hypothetical protein
MIFYGQLGIVLALASIGMVQSFAGALGHMALLGLSYSVLATTVIHAMPTGLAVAGSRVAALNLGFLPIGIGALIGPGLVARLEERAGQRRALLAVGFSMLLPAALVALAPPDDFPGRAAVAGGEAMQYAQFGLLAFALLLYFAIENCLDVWPAPYLKDIGHSERGVAFGLTAFWVAFLAARLLVGIFGSLGTGTWLLLILALLAASALGNLVGAYGRSSGSFGFWLVGLCYGPLLPGALALVPVVTPDRPAAALGVLLALSGLDTLLVRPYLIAYAQQHPARAVMRVPTVLALLLAAPLLVLALTH